MEISKQLFQVYFQILLHFLKCLCHTQLHFLLQRTNRTSCFISYLFLKCEFNYNSFLWPYRWVLFCLFAADTVPLKQSTLKQLPLKSDIPLVTYKCELENNLFLTEMSFSQSLLICFSLIYSLIYSFLHSFRNSSNKYF